MFHPQWYIRLAGQIRKQWSWHLPSRRFAATLYLYLYSLALHTSRLATQRFTMDAEVSSAPTSNASRKNRKHRRPQKEIRDLPQITALLTHPVFLGLGGLLLIALSISFWLVLVHPDMAFETAKTKGHEGVVSTEDLVPPPFSLAAADGELPDGPHLTPRLPHLPIFAEIPNGDKLAEDVMNGKPTIAGIAQILKKFTLALHEANLKLSTTNAEIAQILEYYYSLANEHLSPFESAYRGKSIFPVREDDSIYMSLAAFREHLLAQTMKSAFDQAENPDKIFIGAVVQNCFGNDGRICRTGLQVVGKDKNGRDRVDQFDAPPDVNGIEEFCTDSKYKIYCDRGQIRTLYIHDTDALGPAVARYYASKLWGGETFFLQMDSHLEFAPQWDTQYIAEAKAAKAYPKAVLSAYPPGFKDFGEYKGGSPGARLCVCEFSANQVENHIIRINVGARSQGDAPRPTQVAFIAAGFFFARSEFLMDVPFDPYVPWCFMGEEIALSMRAWTAGWDIYAPRKNLIAHQYRPGRLGLPKFWEAVGRDSHRPNLNTRLQQHVIRRIKHMVGYPSDSIAEIEKANDEIVLAHIEHYGMGKVRTREAYLALTLIDPVKEQCKHMRWCNNGELE